MASIKLKGDTSGELTISAPSVAGTNTLNLPASSGTLATTAQASIGMKNLIINGNMQIAQRGTSASGLTGDNFNYNSVDRFQTVLFTTTSVWTQSQSTDVPTGQGFSNSLKMDCTTADASLDAGTNITIEHKMEGQNLQHLKKGTASAESLTLSFWVKSNKTGTYIVEIDDNDNSRNINNSYTINAADTWEKKTITIDGDTSGTLDNDNGLSLRVIWWLAVGSNYTSGTLQTSLGSTVNANRGVGQVNLADNTSNYINITGVQLEVGTTATPFENLQYGQQLALCQRYYQEITKTASYDNVTNASIWQTTNAFGVFTWLPMRASPTITATFTDFVVRSAGTSYNATSGSFANIRPDRCQFNLGTSGLTVGYSAWYTFDTDAITSPPQKIAISAEL